jgi:hypothetical protein
MCKIVIFTQLSLSVDLYYFLPHNLNVILGLLALSLFDVINPIVTLFAIMSQFREFLYFLLVKLLHLFLLYNSTKSSRNYSDDKTMHFTVNVNKIANFKGLYDVLLNGE